MLPRFSVWMGWEENLDIENDPVINANYRTGYRDGSSWLNYFRSYMSRESWKMPKGYSRGFVDRTIDPAVQVRQLFGTFKKDKPKKKNKSR